MKRVALSRNLKDLLLGLESAARIIEARLGMSCISGDGQRTWKVSFWVYIAGLPALTTRSSVRVRAVLVSVGRVVTPTPTMTVAASSVSATIFECVARYAVETEWSRKSIRFQYRENAWMTLRAPGRTGRTDAGARRRDGAGSSARRSADSTTTLVPTGTRL